MMSVKKLTSVFSYIALGAFAAYAGFWWSGGERETHLLPIVSGLGMTAFGLAALARFGRHRGFRTGSGSDGHAARPQAGMAASYRAKAEGAAEDDRQGGAALLSHEIKNYLCTLKGNARLLRLRTRDLDRTIIDRIDRVVEKLESFTRDLSMAPTANLLVRPLLPEAAAKTCITTHFHTETALFRWVILDGSYILGDPDRLEQVFLNLYRNAVEAGATRVITSFRRIGDRLRLRIEDNGRGCAREDVERIFEPFFTTKHGPARRGLGMFIVQSIVENHGGRILAETMNGTLAGSHGMAFTLEFPVVGSPQEIPGIRRLPEEPAQESLLTAGFA